MLLIKLFRVIRDNFVITGRRIINQLLVAAFFLVVMLFFLYLPVLIHWGEDAEQFINVYMFTEFVAPESVRAFEKETGIKVNIQYYESNEELYAKFKMNGGVGYDVITPSDYMIEYLKNDRLLHKIDYKKMPHTAQLDKRLLGHYFDANNEYSVPLTWSVYGIIYDKSNMQDPQGDVAFDFIFKNPEDLVRMALVKKPYKICIFDDPRDVVLIAAYYLFGKTKKLGTSELTAIESLLVDQKQWVECYTNFGLRYFLEGSIISFALTLSRYAFNILDVTNGRFGFKIPQKGSFWVIENFAIPAASKKVAWAQKFINFMISRHCCTHHFNEYGGNPVNQGSYQDVLDKSLDDLQFFPSDALFGKLELMHNELPLWKVEDIWLRVKTA